MKEDRPAESVPQPVNCVDGIPDRSPSRSAWPMIVIAIVFVLWLGVLLYSGLAGQPS